MNTTEIVFDCRVITPMFLAGADGQTPELRAPSIKGAMRFWWRALNGHLVEKDEKTGKWEYSKLKKEEGKLFGGTGDQASRCPFSMQLIAGEREISPDMPLVPHDRKRGRQDAFSIGQPFQVKIRGDAGIVAFVEAMFPLTAALGGVGKRSRRGMGAFAIEKVKKNGDEVTNRYPTDTAGIFKLVEEVAKGGHFDCKDGIIHNKLSSTPDYPFLRSIELGGKDARLLEKVSQATHDFKAGNPYDYEDSMGHANNRKGNGRFASPVYVSVLAGHFPVVSTLNAVPDSGSGHKINRKLQADFKHKIL
jgi:CRISPR-associated protein Cmr1